jgi:transposase
MMAVYLGIDWSQKEHMLVFLNEKGGKLAETKITRTANGFAKLDEMRKGFGVEAAECIVGIESSYLLLVDWLWDHGYRQLYIVAPNVTHSRQKTYSHSGARTDSRDAYLIANLLRTDRHLLQPWQPNSRQTQELSTFVSMRMQRLEDRLREENRLRDLLIRYHPSVLAAFSLNTDVGLAFLLAYPTPQAVEQLTWPDFQAFARAQGYAVTHHAKAFAKLQADFPVASPDVVAVYQPSAMLLAQQLMNTRRTLKQIERQVQAIFAVHPDAFIYASLPGVGDILAPALLSKLGDDRSRYPRPDVLQAIAGTAPVTKQSGKVRYVQYRQDCDRELRHIVQQWAMSSVKCSPWALAYFTDARGRGHSASRAYRGLANCWLKILWTLWQACEPYDEAFHLQQVRLRKRPRG